MTNNYQLISGMPKIGGFGIVRCIFYDGKVYVLKTPQAGIDLQNELTILKKLKGENIVSIVKDELIENSILMEYTGKDLHHFLVNNFNFDKNFANDFLNQLLPALNHIHQLGYTHRDIKPSNITFNEYKNKFTFIDFGLALEKTERCTWRHGTYSYMTNTIIWNKFFISFNDYVVGDVYALGLTLFNLLNKIKKNNISFFDFLKTRNWDWKKDDLIIYVVNCMIDEELSIETILHIFHNSTIINGISI